MVGASGAIGGVMGAYAVLFPKAPVHMLVFLGFLITRIAVPAYFMLGYWFLLQLISAVPTIGRTTGGVAFWAHIGGFLAGIILVKLFVHPQRFEARQRNRAQTFSIND
jgi:membrane associated rhomboid family serine protease